MTAPTHGLGVQTPPATARGTAPWPPTLGACAMKLSGGMMVTLGFGVFLSVMASMGGGPLAAGAGVLLIIYVLFTAIVEHQGKMMSTEHALALAEAQPPSHTSVQRQADVAGTISPSRQRGYNRLMAIFNAQQVVGLPKDQAFARLVPFFGDKRFTRHLLDHPNVERLLGWNQPVAAVATAGMAAQAAAPRNKAWWQEGQAQPAPKYTEPAPPAPGSVEASTGAFWSSEPSTAAEPAPAATPDDFMIGASGGAVCGAAGCDRGVTDFDYRCFTCRKRFCMTHRGAGVDCPTCAST